ncbi:MAG: DUF4294 domain-containing protein [Flavobacteriales bacterium]|nr:DUF4294 domain-containing protein [Flavobacteriia bacterium]NCP04981.1 DUF4294 domain-containing protein [Flavobacteriales bacterium]PIV94151.1 MAG: DUF4294 domain-containing protein [Flavobacteriaceae bacterium CG17_big_fil_post_rev_8_21_14_2_50_33_15]PIY09590.1 MAG: DUF4294 domain-containing protein [Flavobacteriaceae bacterium CG_4_10_14_3_um_filter_33_47]PJB17379.1 MAG: DUF4294 domain-containing protein [Flavobacteriaceae bacterium CG_4_9_14_3_um_filter_33_16]
MNYLPYILFFLPIVLFSQERIIEKDSTEYDYYIIEGDSIPRETINLEEVYVLNRLKFDNQADRMRYLILRRKTIKVYPYAKMAADRLDSLNTRLEKLKTKREKRQYTKLIQKYIEGEFSDKLKKFTRTEGQILIKLIHRQTGETTFDLIKELRSGWRAFWYNTTASMFDLSLKKGFDPLNVKEDFLIEDILQRNFMSGVLERQKAAKEYNFLELSEKWMHYKKP